MAIYKRDIVDINLETGNIHRSFLKHSIGYLDQQADRFGIRTYRDGAPVDLSGVSVQGIFMPPQGSPISITGVQYTSVIGNEAIVVLPQACYNYDGQFTLAIKLVDSTNAITGTMRIIDGMVDNTHASGTVAPTSAVPTYQEILATYDAMVAATAATNASLANYYSDLPSRIPAGTYCIYNHVLYRCIATIASKGEWDSSYWTPVKLGNDVYDLKRDINDSFADYYSDLPSSIQVGTYCIYNNILYRCISPIASKGAWDATKWEEAKLANDTADLKSAFDNNSDFFLVPETFATTPNRASALNPLTGGNGSYVGFRTGYISYNKPLQITFNEDGYKFVVWTYSTNSTTNAVFAPVKNYVSGTLYLKPVTGSNPCFRIGVIKDSGEAFTEEEAVTTYAKIQYRSQTDKTLLLENVPADAKIVGDKVTAIESDINEINTELVENGKNIVNHHADESGTTSSGLNYSCENDVWTIEGENGDSIWFRTLAGSTEAFPYGLKAGDTVKLYASVLKGTGLYMAFRPYKNGSSLTAHQYDTDIEFTIPSDADAMQIRIEVPKNRTVSSAVTYKPEVRMTDTNKQLEIRVETLENAESTDNSSNIIEPFNREETTSKGLTYSATDGVLTISGTATDTWYTIVGGSGTKLPDGIEPGKTYFFWLDGPEGLRLSLYSFPGSDNIFETSSFGYFTIPADATAIQIRIRVPNGQVIPQGTIVYPYIGKNIPNVSLRTMFGFRSEKPMLTIIDDDGNGKFYTKLLPIIIEKNVPITSATVCGYIDNPSDHSSMTWDQVVECYQKGAEIVSHTMTHVTGTAAETMTEREIERDYRMSRNVLASHGIPTNILVYAGNSGNLDKCVNAAKKTFDYAFHSDGGKVIKQSNFRPFYIQRYGIGIGSFVMQEGETVPSVPKGYIDACIANPGWIVWMIHTSSGDWTDEQVNGIKASIDYALNNGVDIVSCEYALKQFVKT